MDQMIKKTEIRNTEPTSDSSKRIVGILFAVVEVFLAFRLVFKGFGANSDNGFVSAIYSVTQFMVGFFEGIFPQLSTGEQTGGVLEPATFIAIIVIALKYSKRDQSSDHVDKVYHDQKTTHDEFTRED